MIENYLRVQRLVWMSLMGSLVAMGAVAFITAPRTAGAPHFVLAIFIFLAVAQLVVVQVLRAKLLPPAGVQTSIHEELPPADSPQSRDALAKLSLACILSWAMCESVGICGLVATMLLGQPVYYVGFAAVALVFLVLYRPDADDVTGVLRTAAKQ